MKQVPVCVRVSPSLALVKYWGKIPNANNIPATSSIALGLEGLYSETRVSLREEYDRVCVDGNELARERYAAFFDNIRAFLGTTHYYECESSNNFPSAAGLASSSSGFAALAAACVKASCLYLGRNEPKVQELSALARIGSVSAARAVYPGFVILPAKAKYAEPLFSADYWPELRVIVARISDAAKPHSSRNAMEHTRLTSPYHAAWVRDSSALYAQALDAVRERDLNRLGPIIRASTYRMFGDMIAADPAIIYWHPLTLALLACLDKQRKEGLAIYETMDAGPQVKIFCLEKDVATTICAIEREIPELAGRLLVVQPGGGIRYF